AKVKKETKNVITKDMTLGEVISKFPKTVSVFLKHGLHCVGCHVAYWETVEQGAFTHGMDKNRLEALLKDLNAAAKS
ncbi:MAG: DUF1858 domain-containing protein, partial [Candidatus Micrarchaeota archaeon]